jgi:two-component system, OmpR family, phosphate regulon sensor histidine kinase PhoR
MTWLLLLRRAAVIALAMLGGGLVGSLTGQINAPLWGFWIGGGLAVSLIALRDTLRGYRLISWLRGSQEQPAPRDAGLWGELGYRIERALRQRDQAMVLEQARLTQFLSAIEAAPNGVMLLDAGDQIDWCNSLAADHFGLDPQRDRRQRVTNLLRSPVFVAYLQAGDFEAPVHMPQPRGSGLLSVRVRPYGDGLKLVLSLDITERERAEAMRRDFVANVSHEIRTPLTVLSGFIETLKTLPLSGAETEQVLGFMTLQADRMGSLVGDLLTLARLEGSPRPNAELWVNAKELLLRIESEAKALSAGRHTLTFPKELLVAFAGTEIELHSAVANLVSNAVRYTPVGGHIEVSWHLRSDGSGELAVRDTGPGIARSHLPRLTERFYRVDGSRSRDTGGTGLGLAIVKHVIQRHGGELVIESELGQGSVFRLVLPAARIRLREMSSVA